jgi:transposase
MLPFQAVIEISKTDASDANIGRKTEKSPIIRDRLHTIWLLYHGYKRGECANILGLRANTITSYIRLYNQGGLDTLCRLNYKKPVSVMTAHSKVILAAINSLLPDSIAEVRQWISDNLDIERSVESVRVFVKKLGVKYRKTRPFPGGKNVGEVLEKQELFKEEKLFPLLKYTAIGTVDLIFMDAAHFVMGRYNGHVWSMEPCYKPTAHGRYRINVIGGLDIKKRQVFSLFNDTSVNAGTIAGYLQWLRNAHYLDLDKRLYIVLDNAQYQYCDWVKEEADNWNIELVFLPTYSPNLNIIERLWKHMKRQLAKEYFNGKETFEAAIMGLLENVNSEEFSAKFDTLFSLKFQSFEKSKILTW